jgi:hypothetical protein
MVNIQIDTDFGINIECKKHESFPKFGVHNYPVWNLPHFTEECKELGMIGVPICRLETRECRVNSSNRSSGKGKKKGKNNT